MSYFIKETKRKGDLYYQIYEGHYDKGKGYSVQTSYKVLGYLSDLKAKGIDNPKEYSNISTAKVVARGTLTWDKVADLVAGNYKSDVKITVSDK